MPQATAERWLSQCIQPCRVGAFVPCQRPPLEVEGLQGEDGAAAGDDEEGDHTGGAEALARTYIRSGNEKDGDWRKTISEEDLKAALNAK